MDEPSCAEGRATSTSSRPDRPGPAILFDPAQATKLIDRAWASGAPRRTAPLRARDLRAAQRHRLTILKAGGHPRAQHGAGRQQPRLPHVARHRRSLAADTPPNGRERWSRRAMDGSAEVGSRLSASASVGERTVIVLADWQGRLPHDPGDRPRPRGLDPHRAPPRRRRRDPLHRHRAVGNPGAGVRGRRDGRRLVAAGRVERRRDHPWCALPMRACALLVVRRRDRALAADPAGAGRAGSASATCASRPASGR